MSILDQIPAEAAVAVIIAMASAPLFLELVKHFLAISREERAERRKREAEKERAREEAEKNPAGASFVPPGLVVIIIILNPRPPPGQDISP